MRRRAYVDEPYYGLADYITINQNISDPVAIVSGDICGPEIQWVRDNSYRCRGEYDSGLGIMCVCPLSDSDSYLYADGSYAGTSGERYMRLPRFYYHVEEFGPDIWKIGISRGKVADDWKEWDGNDLIGVYKAYANMGLYSRSGEKPSYGTIAQFENMLNFYQDNRSLGFSLVRWRHHCIMALLFYAYYGNTNCQEIVGHGTIESMKITGATDNLGMEDTVVGGNGDSGSINFWGLENWWGDAYEWMEDVSVNGSTWAITDLDGSQRLIEANPSAGVITRMVFGENIDMVPTAVNNYSYAQGFCDYYFCDGSSSNIACRSCDGSYAHGGVACVDVLYDGNYIFETIGSRKCYRGPIVVVPSSYFS